jgi:hypothetical protein
MDENQLGAETRKAVEALFESIKGISPQVALPAACTAFVLLLRAMEHRYKRNATKEEYRTRLHAVVADVDRSLDDPELLRSFAALLLKCLAPMPRGPAVLQ